MWDYPHPDLMTLWFNSLAPSSHDYLKVVLAYPLGFETLHQTKMIEGIFHHCCAITLPLDGRDFSPKALKKGGFFANDFIPLGNLPQVF